jgi:PIN domain nuclease of toxin-antitoxin system
LRLLLDTNVLVWWLTDSPSLPESVRPLITSRETTVFVSAASCWEIAIKVRSGKWSEAAGLVPGMADVLARAKLTPLAVTVSHAERAGLLGTDHKDPFDRLLAAQALEENLVLASVDPVFHRIDGLTVV